MKVYETLNLYAKDLVIGQHGIWWPSEAIKIPFQFGGKIQKYTKPKEASYDLASLGEEVGMLRWLAARSLAPPIGEWIYFKTVISAHLGAYWADPCGAYGYRMADASSLAPGALRTDLPIDTQIKRVAGTLIAASPGAWNDLNKYGNVINGYLIDVRRSGWDRLRWYGEVETVPRYVEDVQQLHSDLRRDGQFPFREREHAYQEYYLDGHWHDAERDVRDRAKLFSFPYRALANDTILDLGTQVGSFLQFAYLDGQCPGTLVGIDSNPTYIDLAQRLARANGMNICYVNASIEDLAMLVNWLGVLWDGRINHLLMLSMLKHLRDGEAGLWRTIETLRPGYAYIETNAVKVGDRPLEAGAFARKGYFVGESMDRNRRHCYRVPGE